MQFDLTYSIISDFKTYDDLLDKNCDWPCRFGTGKRGRSRGIRPGSVVCRLLTVSVTMRLLWRDSEMFEIPERPEDS